MFLLNLFRHICKSTSFALRNRKKGSMYGTKLVLRLAFALEIEHSNEN
jgi:hypothetical protein